jgi:hypothetical protein
MPERRNYITRPNIGDVVEVKWKDHFQFSDTNEPPTTAIEVKSWGRLAHHCKEGVAIAQTEVNNEAQAQHPVSSIHTGQFIVRGAMVSIERMVIAPEVAGESHELPGENAAPTLKVISSN